VTPMNAHNGLKIK